MLERIKQRFVGQHIQKLARLSQATRLGIGVFSTPIRYQRDFAGEEGISWPPWLCERELLTGELLSLTSSINTDIPMALTIGQILARPTLFFRLAFYTLPDQYFSS